jgi:hypothetical protein
MWLQSPCLQHTTQAIIMVGLFSQISTLTVLTLTLTSQQVKENLAISPLLVRTLGTITTQGVDTILTQMMVTVECIIMHRAVTLEPTIKRITLINIPTLQQLVPFMDELSTSMLVGTTGMLMRVMATQATHMVTQTVMT